MVDIGCTQMFYFGSNLNNWVKLTLKFKTHKPKKVVSLLFFSLKIGALTCHTFTEDSDEVRGPRGGVGHDSVGGQGDWHPKVTNEGKVRQTGERWSDLRLWTAGVTAKQGGSKTGENNPKKTLITGGFPHETRLSHYHLLRQYSDNRLLPLRYLTSV